MSISIANLNPTFDTFQSWVTKTNQIADAMSTVVLTTAANSVGGQNSANVYLNGIMSANVMVAGQSLRGGSVSSSGNLAITSNVAFTGANVDVTATYLNLHSTLGRIDTTTLTVEGTTANVTSNLYVKTNTLTVVAPGRVGVNTYTADAALSVVGGANVSANVTVGGVLTVSGNTALNGAVTFANTIAITGNVLFSNSFVATGNVLFSNTTNTVGTATFSNNTIMVGNVVMSNTLSVTGATTLNNTLLVSGATTFNNPVTINSTATATKITFAAGSTNGIFWPDNAYGGTSDVASITLLQANSTSEDLRMTFTLGNDATDKFNFVAPSNDGLMMNGYTVWHSGNDGAGSGLDADVLDGLNQTVSATGSTIMARDSSGDTYARYFRGTATTAQYADLAEKYLADQEYEVGTVVVVGGSREVTACSIGQRALGAVSEKPAFRMNEDLEGGTFIALKGRVPVKVSGPVTKGQGLIAGVDGTATAADPLDVGVFGLALETNVDFGTKLVEAVIL